MGGTNGGEVIIGEFFHADATDVVPEPMGINFVADDIIPDTAVLGIRRAVTFGESFNARGVRGGAFRIREVESSEIVRGSWIVFRMQHQFVERFIAALVIEEDQTDDDIRIRERLDLTIEVFERAFVDGKIAVGGDGQEIGEVNVERGMFDAESKGIIDHLDLEALL